MPASPMNTDTAAQATSANKIQTMADELQSILGQMQAEVDQSASVWSGGSHTAYMGGSADIHAQIQQGQAALQQVSEKVSRTGVGYGHTDESGTSALSSTGL